MVRRKILGLLSITALLLVAPLAAAQGPGRHADSTHRYDPETVTTLTGEVLEVLLRAGRGGATGLHLQVKAEDETVEVLVGPTFYVFPKGLEADQGDTVTVTGSRFTAEGTSMLMAREITVDGVTVELRDEAGMPLWRGQGPRHISR